jgi:hypothetical protein
MPTLFTGYLGRLGTLKATFFAVFASFTNLALSASALATKYMNHFFVVSREVVDNSTDQLVNPAEHSVLGLLLVVVALITIVAPILTVYMSQKSPLRSVD